MSPMKQVEQLERIVLDYIERYGLTEQAREYFCQRSAPERTQQIISGTPGYQDTSGASQIEG